LKEHSSLILISAELGKEPIGQLTDSANLLVKPAKIIHDPAGF